MADPVSVPTFLHEAAPEELYKAFARFLPEGATPGEREQAVLGVLRGPAGPILRAEVGRWITERMVPVEALVPAPLAKWRPPVREAMLFVVSHLSDARLAPKILEQIELPSDTPPETRLLKLIAKVPGLQKLGQVLSRNRHLRPSVREALAELENGIRDVRAEDMTALIQRELGRRLKKFAVEIEPAILSEASVSAVLRFTWKNPESGQRERGVFKVLKPHIPVCFAEDMELLQGLAEYFGAGHPGYGIAEHVVPDTFIKVRRLLEHEVDFPREQRTLLQAGALYRSVADVRVPRLIRPLCTATITAISEEHGVKITSAAAHLPAWRRGRMAGQLVDALIAVPLLTADSDAMFHADPHPGNLLYNTTTGELVILDWALTEHLSRAQRRHLALLFFTVGLRDPVGAANEIMALCEHPVTPKPEAAQWIRHVVAEFLGRLPLTRLPSMVDAMLLVEQLAVKGILFPAPLVMFSKTLFTLDSILDQIGGSGTFRGLTIARHLMTRWLTHHASLGSPLAWRDWIAIQCSTAFCGARLWVQWEQALLDRVLPAANPDSPAVTG
jgi:ubiquinone biosynthesis protein